MLRVRNPLRALSWLRRQVDADERRLVFQAAVVGVVVWLFVATLKYAVHVGMGWTAALLAGAPTIAVVYLPLSVGAVCLSLLAGYHRVTIHYRDDLGKIHALNGIEGDGVERAIALYFTSEPTVESALLGNQGVEARWRLPTFTLALKKMLGSWITLVSGGAGGLEASVTLVGESTAAGLFKPRSIARVVPDSLRARVPALIRRPAWFRRALAWWRSSQAEDLQAAQLCGIAAAVATLLGTPFAAAFFAVEIIYRRRPIVDRLIYALISALIAFFLNHLVTGTHSSFPAVTRMPPLYVGRYYIALSALAISIGLLSTAFRVARTNAERFFHTRITPSIKRHVAGALLTGTFAVLAVLLLRWLELPLPQGLDGASAAWLVLGPGENIIDWALHGQIGVSVALIALAARFLATISTITSGGSAGLLFPTLTFGCLTASAWAGVFELDAAFLVIPAMTASLGAVANVPLAAIMLVVEGFGSQWIVPAMFVLVLSSITAHNNSIYRAQRESFDPGQILPGMSVRRVRVPMRWAGSDLRSLGVRETYGLTVIGMVDRKETADGTIDEKIVLNPRPERMLTEGDMLIVLGEDDRIESFSAAASLKPTG